MARVAEKASRELRPEWRTTLGYASIEYGFAVGAHLERSGRATRLRSPLASQAVHTSTASSTENGSTCHRDDTRCQSAASSVK